MLKRKVRVRAASHLLICRGGRVERINEEGWEKKNKRVKSKEKVRGGV